jgi:hypothetical protein
MIHHFPSILLQPLTGKTQEFSLQAAMRKTIKKKTRMTANKSSSNLRIIMRMILPTAK